MRILSVEINGIKSIDKKISFSFYRKTLAKSFDENTAIKAIYGPNGSGKTGIISAFSLYKNIVLYRKSLETGFISSMLKSLINKKTKVFYMSVIFANKVDDVIRRYKHEIEISLKTGEPLIVHEKVSNLTERYEENIKFETKNGEVVINSFSAFDKNNILEDACKNVCQSSSFCSLLLSTLSKIKTKTNELLDIYGPVILVYLLSYSISVCFGSRNDSLFSNYLESNDNDLILKRVFKQQLCKIVDSKKFMNNHYEYSFEKDDLDKFEEYLKKMYEFISVIKPDLKAIEHSTPIFDGECYRCRLNFVYDEYFIDFQFESTGIKKLVDLYETLSSGSKGNIAIIDEFDAGLHDVVFEKLIKYFYENANCQLIFTTHNLNLLDYLKDISNTIDFISCDSVVTHWIIDGTLSPSNTFKKGGIPHIPFNFESYDFIGKF